MGAKTWRDRPRFHVDEDGLAAVVAKWCFVGRRKWGSEWGMVRKRVKDFKGCTYVVIRKGRIGC